MIVHLYFCLLVELTDILFILQYLKTKTNEVHDDLGGSVTDRIQFILQTNGTLRAMVSTRLAEKNANIVPDEFPLIRDIIFHYHNAYILHYVNLQQYLSRMLTNQNEQKPDYFISWFQFFLCESNPTWMNYQNMLREWTDCFVYKPNFFSRIIEQIDTLIEIWDKVAPQDRQRSHFFTEDMVSQCLGQGKNDHFSCTFSQ